MVRTKADSCSRKAVAAKAPRKISTPTRTSAGSDRGQGAKKSGAGGNACMSRPVPEWQKPISMFFSSKTPSGDGEAGDEQQRKKKDTNKEDRTTDKENNLPDEVEDDLVELSQSDSEETINTSKKVLNKRRQEDFMNSDDDDE